MTRISVLLVSQDYYSRYALHALLSKDPRTTVVDEARDVDEVRWLLEADGKPTFIEVLLFDADFCHGAGPTQVLGHLMQVVRAKQLRSKLLCCMTDLTLEFIRAAVQAGCDGILKKEEVAGAIADAVDKVHQGAFVYTKSVSDRAFGRLFQSVRHTTSYMVPPPHASPLNRKLARVARLYCEDGLAASEVAELLHVTEAGVRAQIQQIYRTLGVHDRREARRKLVELEGHQ